MPFWLAISTKHFLFRSAHSYFRKRNYFNEFRLRIDTLRPSFFMNGFQEIVSLVENEKQESWKANFLEIPVVPRRWTIESNKISHPKNMQ